LQHQDAEDLPMLEKTGARELDRLVEALNATGQRLSEARRRAASAERLAATGRLAAGIAHEIRNPIAAMRLKAENALPGADERRGAALRTILDQIARLDVLLRNLLTMTHPPDPCRAPTDIVKLLQECGDAHRELAAAKGVRLEVARASQDIGTVGLDPGRVKTFSIFQKLHAAGRDPRRRDHLSIFWLYRIWSQSGHTLGPR